VLDEDNSGVLTWLEFLESVADGDFHKFGVEGAFEKTVNSDKVDGQYAVLLKAFKKREEMEQQNEVPFSHHIMISGCDFVETDSTCTVAVACAYCFCVLGTYIHCSLFPAHRLPPTDLPKLETLRFNKVLIEEIENSALTQDLGGKKKKKLDLELLASDELRMLEILFNVFDFKKKGRLGEG
jgi:hypothetical protein